MPKTTIKNNWSISILKLKKKTNKIIEYVLLSKCMILIWIPAKIENIVLIRRIVCVTENERKLEYMCKVVNLRSNVTRIHLSSPKNLEIIFIY